MPRRLRDADCQRDLTELHTALAGPGGPVPFAAIQAAVHEEITGYWRQVSRKRRLWRQDSWVDHGLVMLPRAEAVLAAGDLITKGQAISRLAGFGVPDTLAREIRRRRDGDPVVLSRPRRLVRALRARRIMRHGVARLSQWPELAA